MSRKLGKARLPIWKLMRMGLLNLEKKTRKVKKVEAVYWVWK